jgi:UDP-N-acetylmuramate dehydrogenase
MALTIINNKDLTDCNTFGMKVKCNQWISYDSVDELKQAIKLIGNAHFLHIGAGSNMLFTGDFDGTILHSNIKGWSVVSETDSRVCVKAGSGLVFDDFIAEMCQRNFWGIENLSAIPGEVGASAVQNIGAYGVEVKDVISEVECIDTTTGATVTFSNAECGYDYRDSRFKHDKNHYIVTYVTFTLSKIAAPKLSYGNLSAVIPADCTDATAIRNAVCAVRLKKLPDVKQYGSAGSFFKNPVVDKDTFEAVCSKAAGADVPHYVVGNKFKIPAAWLIEQCGWKGKTVGNAGVWHLQPLVLINATGKASAQEIIALENDIINSVNARFGIALHPEVEHI